MNSESCEPSDETGPPDARRAVDSLLPVVYEQLRAIAKQRMASERKDHTLQATALVHEAYVRLAAQPGIESENRAHFFAAAAEAMRRILIEHARAVGRIKRGGRAQRALMPLNVLDLAANVDADEILMLEDAIRRLGEAEPEVGKVVQLRFYAGLSVDETAAALGISPSTVDRDWAYARAWLHRALASP